MLSAVCRRLAVELTSDATIRTELLRYAVQRPRREVMRWYGPFLLQRARTFLLVMERWRGAGQLCVPKDVVTLILQRLMETESVPFASEAECSSCWARLRQVTQPQWSEWSE